MDEVVGQSVNDLDDDLTGVDLDALDPRALSVRIPLDQVDWPETDDSLGGPSVSLGPRVDAPRGGRSSMSMPTPAPTPAPAERSGPTGQDNTGDFSQERWTWRDLPLALTAVFDGRRFLVAVVGVWSILMIHGLISWFSMWAGTRNSGLGTLFSLLAAVIFLGLFILVSAICSVICHTDLIEERPVSLGDAIQWTKNWIQSVLGTPLAFIAVVATTVILEALVGFLGRVPFVGAPLWGALTPVTVLCSLIGGLAVVSLAYSLPIYVPVVYNERTAALETLKRLLELLKLQGARIIGSLLATLTLTAVSLVIVLFPAWYIGTELTTRVGSSTMGPGLTSMVSEVPAPFMPSVLLFLDTGGLALMNQVDASHSVGGVLMGVLATLGPALLMGAVTLILSASGCIIYSMVTGRRKG